MAPANLAGPAAADLTPPRRAGAAELRRRIAAREWVAGLRGRRAFAVGHVPGTLSFGLDGSFATYLGWINPVGHAATLLGETPGQVAGAQREPVRIGIDRPAAAATGSHAQWAGGQAPGEAAGRQGPGRSWRPPATGQGSWRCMCGGIWKWAGGHVDGAMHIPLHELPGRIGEVPADQVWVYCQSGYRAALAASLLAAAGRDVVAVDHEFGGAGRSGLPPEGTRRRRHEHRSEAPDAVGQAVRQGNRRTGRRPDGSGSDLAGGA